MASRNQTLASQCTRRRQVASQALAYEDSRAKNKTWGGNPNTDTIRPALSSEGEGYDVVFKSTN